MTHSVSHTNDFQFTFDVLCFAAFTKRKAKKNPMKRPGDGAKRKRITHTHPRTRGLAPDVWRRMAKALRKEIAYSEKKKYKKNSAPRPTRTYQKAAVPRSGGRSILQTTTVPRRRQAGTRRRWVNKRKYFVLQIEANMLKKFSQNFSDYLCIVMPYKGITKNKTLNWTSIGSYSISYLV